MITDAPVPSSTLHDICIVGGGPVGISLAIELAKLGKKVLLLESGALAADPTTQALSDALIADKRVHDDMSIAVARRLGGTSNLWGGRCLPYDRVDFAERAWVADAPLWPIDLGDISPFYEQACRYANCGDPVYTDPIPGVSSNDNRFSHDSLERWSNQPKFQKAHHAILTSHPGIDVRLNSTVVDLDFAENRAEAVIVARPDGSRQRISVKQVVLAAGGVETTRLLLWLQREKLPSAFGGIDGPLGRYYMGHLLGEIADITFADDRVDAAYDFYVDSHGSYVRRRFVPSKALQIEHQLTNVALWPIVPPSADPRHRSGPLSLVTLVLSIGPIGRALIAEAIRKRHIPDDLERWPHVLNILRDLPRTIAFAPILLWRRYFSKMRHPGFYVRNAARRYGLSYHAEQLPNPESRVQLSDETDRYGLPRVKIDLRFQEKDAIAIVKMHTLLADWLQRTGFGTLEYRQPESENLANVLSLACHGTHQVGLTRMASSAADGVVDSNLRGFGCDNLYVASTSVLPTSGQANPTLTTIALALRLAQHLSSKDAPGVGVAK